MTFFGIASFQVLAMFRRGLFYSYLSIYLRFFLGMSVTETTLFATFPMILNVGFQTFVWGRLSDRLRLRRTLIVIGELTAAVFTLAVWYGHTLPSGRRAAGYVIIAGLSLVEAFWSMSNVSWTALLSDLYPARERAGLQGRIHSVGALGRIAGIWAGGLLYDGLARTYEGWGFEKGALFFIASGVMAVSTIPLFFLPEGGPGRSGADPAGDPLPHGRARPRGGDASSRRFMVFLAAMVLVNFGMNSVVLIKSQYLSLDEGMNVSSRLLGHILNSASIAILLVGLVVVRASARWGDGPLLFAGALLGMGYLSVYLVARTVGLFFLAEFLAGAAWVVFQSAAYAHASKLIPASHRGRHFAWFNATQFLSWGLPGTILTGPLVDSMIRAGAGPVDAYRSAFAAALLLVFAGLLVLFAESRYGPIEPRREPDDR